MQDTMAHAASFVSTLQGPSLRQRLDAAWASVAQRAARRRLYRTTLREFGALSDRDLQDLGLHRAQIRDVARQAAFQA